MIVLVEDNANDEILTLDALRSGGVKHPIIVARDGQEALDYLFCEGEHARRAPCTAPDLVLLDLKLPKVRGTEVLRRMRGDPRTRLTPVVVLTSSSEQEDIDNCYGAGANSYVRKPVEFDKFQHAVRALGIYWLTINERPSRRA